jgi:hypothetical protein
MPTPSSWARPEHALPRPRVERVAWGLAGLGCWIAVGVSPAQAQPPPSNFEQLTAPMPPDGRRGRAPPPRLPDRLQPDGPDDPSAQALGLVRQEDGGYLYLDPGRRFTARFEPDGRVQFADRWRRPDPSRPQRGAMGGRPAEGVMAGLNPFAGAPVQGPAEWITRSLGQDPTGSAKMRLLEETRTFRTRLAVAFALELIANRLAALGGELQAIWNASDLDPESKRRLLFARWDECAERFEVPTEALPEQAITQIDEARLEAAANARKQIEAFVRRHAPHDGPHAFSRSELARLNAQRVSASPFAPYGTRGTP